MQISSRNMQEYYNDNSPTKSGGKLDYYNIDWLSGVIIDRTVVLHELRFEDFGIVPEGCSLGV